MDEPLYNCLKQLEMAVSNLWLSLPMKDSAASNALKIMAKDDWRMGCLIHNLSWLQDQAKQEATSVYMQGKE